MSDEPKAPRGQPGNSGRPSREEWEERVDYTLSLLNRRLPKSEIKKQLAEKFGAAARSCERYMQAARQQIVAASGKPKAEHKLESLWFYESVVADQTATLQIRLAAQNSIDKLLGLCAPQRIRHGGDEQAPPIKLKLEAAAKREAELLSLATVEELKQLRELRVKLEARLAAKKLVNGRASLPPNEN
jgi:hypothetical protein